MCPESRNLVKRFSPFLETGFSRGSRRDWRGSERRERCPSAAGSRVLATAGGGLRPARGRAGGRRGWAQALRSEAAGRMADPATIRWPDLPGPPMPGVWKGRQEREVARIGLAQQPGGCARSACGRWSSSPSWARCRSPHPLPRPGAIITTAATTSTTVIITAAATIITTAVITAHGRARRAGRAAAPLMTGARPAPMPTLPRARPPWPR